MPNKPMSPPTSKSSKGKFVLAGVTVVTVVSLIVIVYFFMSQNNISGPIPEVTIVDGREDLQGLTSFYYVDVEVKNNGDGGWVTVYAEISGLGRYQKQDQRIYLETEGSESFTFTFDVTPWGSQAISSITCTAWAITG